MAQICCSLTKSESFTAKRNMIIFSNSFSKQQTSTVAILIFPFGVFALCSLLYFNLHSSGLIRVYTEHSELLQKSVQFVEIQCVFNFDPVKELQQDVQKISFLFLSPSWSFSLTTWDESLTTVLHLIDACLHAVSLGLGSVFTTDML